LSRLDIRLQSEYNPGWLKAGYRVCYAGTASAERVVMAYGPEDYRFTVRGTLNGTEEWANTWCVGSVADAANAVAAAAALHDFYTSVALHGLGSGWQATTCQSRNLDTGVTTDHTWATITGDDLAHMLPNQIAVRVSLSTLSGVNGGPFLAGFSESANDSTGTLNNTDQSDLADDVETLANDLDAIGCVLSIDRPTVPATVPAVRARVGQRFDVIRKRANELPETYESRTLPG
jgi:hypothetical protein